MPNIQEARHMGALSFIKREQRPRTFASQEPVVLVIQDEAKTEMSSGLPQMRVPDMTSLTYGLPGGGRQLLQEDVAETLLQTLQREIAEEAMCYPHAVLEALNSQLDNGGIERLAYPFLVAQWRKNKQSVDIIPAVTVVQDFDALPREVRQLIDAEGMNMVDGPIWASIRVLNTLFMKLRNGDLNDKRIHLLFRPQVLTAAYLYTLQYIERIPTTIITASVIKDNAEIYRAARHFTENVKGWELNNGAISPDGSLNSSALSEQDIEYLLGDRKDVHAKKTAAHTH